MRVKLGIKGENIIFVLIMSKKDYDALRKALQNQRKEISSSKGAAKKFLKDAGVLLVVVAIRWDQELRHCDRGGHGLMAFPFHP